LSGERAEGQAEVGYFSRAFWMMPIPVINRTVKPQPDLVRIDLNSTRLFNSFGLASSGLGIWFSLSMVFGI
jgi:hypothetical protein